MVFELHRPVLLDESIAELIGERKPEQITLVDATLWLGGHSSEILKQLGPTDRLIGIDRDSENLEKARTNIGNDSRFIGISGSFALLPELLAKEGIHHIDGILYDLWVSSVHYDDGERGFSFRFDGPLDMRFDRTEDIPKAADLVQSLSERELFRIMRDYADEPKAIYIARAIVEARKHTSITTTFGLSEIIEKASFDPKSVLRAFQALRIEVNHEFEHIETSLRHAIRLMNPGARLCVITFHSIEDRVVKNLCKQFEVPVTDQITGRILEKPSLKKVHKKLISPSEKEIKENPRARSANLRVYQKL